MVFIPPLKPLGSIVTVDENDERYIARINEEIGLRDGGRVRANVFLPRSGGPKWPVLVSSSPYGKDVSYTESKVYRPSGALVPMNQVCEHLRFEAPSPAWWCPNGYVLIYWDHRGSGNSPGVLKPFHDDQHDDYCEVITWAADQPWSTGKVGLSGISYLALNQWPAAVRNPRGLECIIPWEGMADYYRDSARKGGIICNGLKNRWWFGQVLPMQYGSGNRAAGNFGPDSTEGILTEEQLLENRDDVSTIPQDAQFIDDEYFQKRMSVEDYSKITVPLLSAGNWGGINLHLRGNVMSFMRAQSQYKFLRIHTGRHDLPYYSSPYIEYQKSFYDCFLKGDDYDGWKSGKQPAVRFAVRQGQAEAGATNEADTFKWRDENEWPLARTEYKKLFLSPDKTLSASRPTTEGTLSYQGFDGDCIRFEFAATDKSYEICGHPSVRVALGLSDHEGETPAEMDVFFALRKFDASGKEVQYTASTGDLSPVTFGWVRASQSALAQKPFPELGELPFPTLSHLRKDKKVIQNGGIYDLQCELWPTNVVVEKDERLVLELCPKDPEGSSFFTCNDPNDRNFDKLNGTNTIHFSSQHENYVVLPIV